MHFLSIQITLLLMCFTYSVLYVICLSFLQRLQDFTCTGETLHRVVAAFRAWEWLIVRILLPWTEIASWAGQRGGYSGRAPSSGTGTQRLAVKPRGTGTAFFLSR